MTECKKPSTPGIRWLPHPLLSLILVFIWLLLVNTFSFGQLLLATVLGVAIPWFTNRFWPEKPRIAKPLLLFRFFFITFLYDVIVANLTVVRLMLQPDISKMQPGFFEVFLDTSDPLVISILASVISLTPGTVSSEISQDRRILIVHGLDVPDGQAAAEIIKTRYETPLKEIFSC